MKRKSNGKPAPESGRFGAKSTQGPVKVAVEQQRGSEYPPTFPALTDRVPVEGPEQRWYRDNVVLSTRTAFFIFESGDARMTQDQNYITWIRGLVGDAKIILNAACVVVPNARGEILLQQRSDNGLWGLPGGLKELGESISGTAVREVKEETNLDVVLTGFVGVFINPAMTWRKTDRAEVICHSFIGAITGGELAVNDNESLGFGWFGPDNLPPIHSVDNQETIQAFFAGERNLVEGRRYT